MIRDEELCRQLQEGNEAAMEALVHRHHRAIFAYLYRITGSAHTAEDLAQECFVRVCTRIATYRFPDPFLPWLYTIVRPGPALLPRSDGPSDCPGGKGAGRHHQVPAPSCGQTAPADLGVAEADIDDLAHRLDSFTVPEPPAHATAALIETLRPHVPAPPRRRFRDEGLSSSPAEIAWGWLRVQAGLFRPVSWLVSALAIPVWLLPPALCGALLAWVLYWTRHAPSRVEAMYGLFEFLLPLAAAFYLAGLTALACGLAVSPTCPGAWATWLTWLRPRPWP